ncbi:Phosphoenolpyruvate-protein phosphotransferase [Planctomycetes bacterium Poly30]|uniref:Phosphoenolpyruvate-protein phosphotransferase n=1 Tax=Saltatorellus ferox TaxID=2528018 RepID=A0A518EQM5_9BACT|nr:Phosphoenolpyruvate-protein phosphotransferase [Planctomycetes bacterium Poly30]
MPQIQGLIVAPGLGLGPVHVVRARLDSAPVWSLRADETGAEIERLDAAIDQVFEVLGRRQKEVAKAVGERDAGILGVHQMILRDPGARADVDRAIRDERLNAEAAVDRLIHTLEETMGRLDGDSIRGYAADVTEPWRAVVKALMQTDQESFAQSEDKVVIAAAELTPEAVTFLGRERIHAIVTEAGGRFSHGAVLARSFGIPCVVGIPNLLARLEQNMQVLVDGDHGTIVLDPDEATIAAFMTRCDQRSTRTSALSSHAGKPAVTPDGTKLDVLVNLESVRDLDTFDVSHCDGVGLLRTEFLYMERTVFPSEEEQFRLYRRVVDSMQGRPVTIRTLDIGGDKQLPYFKTPKEANPALGWRGTRVTLEWQDLLRVQLRAVMRATAHGPVRLLIPMISSLDEVHSVFKIFDETRLQLTEQGYDVAPDIPVGIMIEVPSTLWILDDLLAEVDFISVGTNDLVQYLLAVDRDNVFVSGLYEPMHPAVIRALAEIGRAAKRAGKSVCVCGEIAGDEAVAVLLAGMGYDSLSVAPNFLAVLKFAIRAIPLAEAQGIVEHVLRLRSATEIKASLEGIRKRLGEAILAHEAG